MKTSMSYVYNFLATTTLATVAALAPVNEAEASSCTSGGKPVTCPVVPPPVIIPSPSPTTGTVNNGGNGGNGGQGGQGGQGGLGGQGGQGGIGQGGAGGQGGVGQGGIGQGGAGGKADAAATAGATAGAAATLNGTVTGENTNANTNTNAGNTINFAQRRFTAVLGLGGASAKGELNGCAAMRGFNILGAVAWTGEADMIKGCSEAELKKIGVAGAVVDPNIGIRVKGLKAAGINMDISQADKATVSALKEFEAVSPPVTVPVIVREPGPVRVETMPCKVYGTKGANKGKLIDGVTLETNDPTTGKTITVCTGGGDEMAPSAP